jgi:hypothetical protein
MKKIRRRSSAAQGLNAIKLFFFFNDEGVSKLECL